MTVTAGIIGCGNISKFHFSGLEKAGAKIKWVCDISEAASQPWAKKYGASFTKDYTDILNDPAVTAVAVTPISTIHKSICLAAIEKGKAVICEKTLATNADDAFEIVKAAEQKKTIFYTSYMKRFIPAVEKAKELLPSIGKIISTNIRSYQPWGNLWDGNPKDGFFHKPAGQPSLLIKHYGGGILVCGGSHILDLILHFVGRPNRLFASVYTPSDCDYDLHASAMMETNNGIVHYDVIAHPLKKIGFLRDGWDERVEIIGTKGKLEICSALWDQVDYKASMLTHYDDTKQQSIEYRYDPVSPFDRAITFFCGNIAKGTQGSQSRLTGYEVDELIEHIKKSSAAGQAIDIKWRI